MDCFREGDRRYLQMRKEEGWCMHGCGIGRQLEAVRDVEVAMYGVSWSLRDVVVACFSVWVAASMGRCCVMV